MCMPNRLAVVEAKGFDPNVDEKERMADIRHTVTDRR